MANSAYDRIRQTRQTETLLGAVTRQQAAEAPGVNRRQSLGALALLNGSGIPPIMIESLDEAGALRRLRGPTFTISEYTTGHNSTSTMQNALYVKEQHMGWYIPNAFPLPPHDPDSRIRVPTSAVIAQDGTTWTTMWQAYGGNGRIVGVPFDDGFVQSGRGTFVPANAIQDYIRDNQVR